MSFSATDAAFEGFKIVRRHPLAIVFWALTYLVFLGVGFAVAGPPAFAVMAGAEALQAAGGEPSMADVERLMQSYGMLFMLATPLALIAGAILNAAVARSVLWPGEQSFGSLRLGIDELRVIVVTLVLGILIYAVWMVGAGVAIAAGVIAYGTGQGVLWIVAVLLGLAAIVVTIWLSLRLCLAVPIVIAERRWAFFDSFALTRGRVWPLLGMAVIAGVMSLLVSLLGAIVAMPVPLMTGAADPATLAGDGIAVILQEAGPAIIGWIIVNSILWALQLAVLYAPFSAAYRDIKGLPVD